MNYTEEQTALMIEQYQKQPNMTTVEALAAQLSKSKKSIIGKLSKEGVYRRQVYKTKTGDDPVTKIELVSEIAAGLDIPEEMLVGLDKAPKATLKNILSCLPQ